MSIDLVAILSEKGQILGHAHSHMIQGYEREYTQGGLLRVSEIAMTEGPSANTSGLAIDKTFRVTHLKAVRMRFMKPPRIWSVHYLVMIEEKAQWLWDNPGLIKFKQEHLQ